MAIRWLAVATTDETGSNDDSVGMMRAECLMKAGGLRAGLGDDTATGGAGEDNGDDTGADTEPGCAAPSATAAGRLSAEVVAGAPHAATPPAAKAMAAAPSARERIHGMNPLSPPPGATVPVRDNRLPGRGSKDANRRRRVGTNGHTLTETGTSAAVGCALLPHERGLRAPRSPADVACRPSR